MNQVRWLEYARRSMQRLGFLKAVLVAAGGSGPTNLEGVTADFQRLVTKKVEVPKGLKERATTYIRTQRLHNRYREFKGRLELQDLYLSDRDLPSSSGAITGEFEKAGYRRSVYVEIPAWAAGMRLVRKQNYAPTDRGKALVVIGRKLPESLREFQETNNPLLLTTPEKFILLFTILDADGDLLAGMYRLALESKDELTRADMGNLAKQALSTLVSEKMKPSTSGAQREMSLKATRVLEAIEGQSGTGMGPRESVATPRTEPLVDLGLLRRTDRLSYTYAITSQGRLFLERFTSSASISGFLQSGFANAANALFEVSSRGSRRDPFEAALGAYTLLRSGLGYVSIEEIAILTAATSIANGEGVYELSEVKDAIEGAARRYGREVRLAGTQRSGIGQVKIDRKLIESVE